MDRKLKVIKHIVTVIKILKKNHLNEINDGIFLMLYDRYTNALSIIEKEEDLRNINITGGFRAYMDSYSDYQNPLLEELYKAEKALDELL